MNLLFELTLRGSVATIVVVLFDVALASRVSSRSRRFLWCLVPLAFLAPVQLPMIPYLDYVPPTAFAQGIANVNALAPVTAVSNMPRSGASLVGIIWLIGAIAYIALVTVQTTRAYVSWSKVRLSTNPSLLGLLEDCKLETGVTAPIGLVVSESVTSPAILGWLRPRILLPKRFATDASIEELRPIILHELAHFRAFDVPFNWLLMLVRSVHWFNPIAHVGAAAWILFREEAADEEAVKWMKDTSGQAYGHALMQSLRNMQAAVPPFGAFGIVESIGLLKRRINMINQFRNKAPRVAAVGSISILLVAVVCSISANGPEPDAADSMTVVNSAAKEWLSEVDRGEVERSRKEASDYFKSHVSLEQWQTALREGRYALGKLIQRKQVSFLIQKGEGDLKGHTLAFLQFEASYENQKYTLEDVTYMREADGSWKMIGYFDRRL